MPSYPGSLFVPRTVANRVGVVYDALKTKVLFAEDFNNAAAEIVAIQETLGLNPEGAATTVGDRLGAIESDIADLSEDGGWRALAVTPTRQSTDDPVFVLRFAADMTAILGQGMRIKITQNGTVRYLIVVLVGAYTGGNTDVTVYGGTDYDVNDTSTYPITNPFYSREKAPFGFPLNQALWTVSASNDSLQSQSSPTPGVWYNLGGFYLDVPIGCWDVRYQVSVQVNDALSNYCDTKTTLSTANNSESDDDFSCGAAIAIDVTAGGAPCMTKNKVLNLSGKTRYYLNTLITQSGIDTLYNRNDYGDATIRAVCVYL